MIRFLKGRRPEGRRGAERFQRLEAGGVRGCVNADARGRALGRLRPAVLAGTDHRRCR
jgi:hypothetical protein